MLIDNTQFWNDIIQQLDEWYFGGMVGNSYDKKRYNTGYGGPHRPNESISQLDFVTLYKEWTENCSQSAQNPKLACRVAKSLSGGNEDVYDFIAHPMGNDKTNFNYHIKVPGQRGLP